MQNTQIQHLERMRVHLAGSREYDQINVINLGKKVVQILNADFQNKLYQAKKLGEQAQLIPEKPMQTLAAEWDLSDAIAEHEKIEKKKKFIVVK